MKSRVAILGMLVTGMLFSTAGAGLAVSGLADQSTDNAAVSQYGTPTPTPTYVCTPSPGTASASQEGGTGSGGTSPSQNDQCGEGGVLPASDDNAPAPASESGGGALPAQDSQTAAQPERQAAAAAETSQLPFTGFAAIPVLLGGLALLTGGLILRRRTQQ